MLPDAMVRDGGIGARDGGVDAGSAVCGDGIRSPGEACDDGNTRNGDGCSSTCQIEPGWSCPPTGACVRNVVCGDGMLAPSEGCDDGNTIPNDGCSSTCQVEPGWLCPTPGQPCVALACGDGVVAGNEQCDDGNTNNGDGCSSTCQIEPGYVCLTPGEPCTAARCGDGILATPEQCDDGNTLDGDGCSSSCQLEPNYVCPTPNQPCQSTVVCGDGKIGPGEQCDDHNTTSGDGCSSTCQVEPGWVCPVAGAACRAAACGDGIVAGNEQCDDGNTKSGDGCSSTCQLEPGYYCPTPDAACQPTVCGDGVVQGSEQCDDGNTIPFDGCDQNCNNEPMCSGGVCASICGDGVILPGGTEQCDDGNTRNGDGCSSTCQIEPGWTCVNQVQPLPSTITLPLLLRDMKGIQWYNGNPTYVGYGPNSGSYGQPDFNDPNDGNNVISFGILKSQLDANGRPVLAYTSAPTNDGTGLPKGVLTAVSGQPNTFSDWYNSSSPYVKVVVRTLTLGIRTPGTVPATCGNGVIDPGEQCDPPTPATGICQSDCQLASYSYDSDTQGFPPNSTKGFYPIDGAGWNDPALPSNEREAERQSDPNVNDGGYHNFNFTTETHFWFQYDGTEVLNFSGDDDLWVFVDGQLCLDVGGLHPEIAATMDLGNPSNEPNATQRAIVQACKNHLDSLVTAQNPNPIVEMSIFHAERHTTASNFNIQLTGFVKETTSCTQVCGDGIVTPGEVCDNGVNAGNYNGCEPGCQAFGPYCGDGIVNGPEQCDLGSSMNVGSYDGCNPDCTNGPHCGDGVVQPAHEVCDDGSNTGAYGGCEPGCQQRAPYCGDGIVQAADGEQCDDGTLNNTGAYGHCNPNCTLGPRCGDGIKQPNEQCDDGNTVNGDGCSSTCTLELG